MKLYPRRHYLLLLLLSVIHLKAFCQAGSLDSSFKVNGIFSGFSPIFKVQPNGSILGASSFYDQAQANGFIQVERFKNNGATDSSFGNKGIVLMDFNSESENPVQIETCPDGKVVVLGINNDSFIIFKYYPGGKPDSSFDLDGRLSLHFSTNNVYLDNLVVQPDGKLLLAGNKKYEALNYYGKSFFITRINLNGTTDTHFGTNGMVTTIFNSQVSDPQNGMAYEAIASIKEMVLQPDGKIVAAGGVAVWLNGYSHDSIALARYLPDGTPDSSFAFNGKFTLDPSTPENEIYTGYGASGRSVILQPDGKIVIGASCYYIQSHGVWFYSYGALIRLNVNGSLDHTFDQDGINFIGLAPYGSPVKLGLQSDGKILFASTVGSGRDAEISSEFAMVRILEEGSHDNSFGNNGVVFFNTSDGYPHEWFYTMQLSAGRIYVNGVINSIGGLFAIKNDGVSVHPQQVSFCAAAGEGIVVSDVQGDTYQWQLSTDSVHFFNIADGSSYGGVHTDTLLLHNVAAAWNGYRFRCLTSKTISNITSIRVLSDSDAIWTGSASNQWEDPANWHCNQLPGSNSNVVIQSGTIIIHSNVLVHSLVVQPGAVVIVDAGYSIDVLNQNP